MTALKDTEKSQSAVVVDKDATVLVVDMDHTLVKTDTLHESIIQSISKNPINLLSMLGWLTRGKAVFKRHLADRCLADVETLPINSSVLGYIRQEREKGRPVALVSAADHRQAEALAAHLGLFDEIHGTGADSVGEKNLRGENKAAFLVSRYGEGGFDYIGDDRVDLPVWAVARRAITVGANARLRARVAATAADVEHLDPPGSIVIRAAALLRAMRPHQWIKNILVFAPIAAAQDLSGLGLAIVAFAVFNLAASSVYLINDLMDLRADRVHPRKRKRPLAAGDLTIHHGVVGAAVLLMMAFTLSVALAPPLFVGALTLYCVATLAYSLLLKRKLIIDILSLAGLYTMRILAGAAATNVVLSPWMLGFSMFLFLSLAATKRQAELADQLSRGRVETAGRAYRTDDLPVLRGVAISAGQAAVLIFALYINSPPVTVLYSRPELLWLVCPVLLYWVTRMVMMTHRGHMTDDPIIFAARDRMSQISGVLAGAAIAAAALLPS
jgi:4-hydroxybenzoate polyprenyltransferase/phosphoserine phosphatase